MKIEKKLVALSILAFTIGIATIAPMTVFMNAKAQDAQAYTDPWFNIETALAYLRVDPIEGGYRVTHKIDPQRSLTDNALSQRAEARIEYFEFTYYTEDRKLLTEIFCISMTNDGSGEHKQSYRNCEIIREKMLDPEYFNLEDGIDGMSGYDIDWLDDLTKLADIRGGGRSFCSTDDRFSTVLEAQTIYLEVKRICYITIDGDNTVITWIPNSDIQRIELTRYGDIFAFVTENALEDIDDLIADNDRMAQASPLLDFSNIQVRR
jgi:hypothetical protein